MVEVAKNLLLVNDEDEYIELPDWCKFYINLGYWAAIREENTKKITVISVPTRAFSSPLIALGLLTNLIENFHITTESAQNHFIDNLYPLENGTTLQKMLEKQNKIFIKDSSDKVDNCPFCNNIDFVISARESYNNSPNKWYGCQSHLYTDIIQTDANIKLNKSKPKFINHNERRKMWFDLFKKYGDKIINFYTQNSKECLIIGSQKVLREELLQNIFAVQNPKGQKDIGNLQNIIRTDDHENIARIHKTDIWSNRRGGELLDFNPKLVIVDGWYSFENHKSAIDYFKSNTIIILDRSAPHYEDALVEINLRYPNKKFNEETYPINDYIEQNRFPDGIEITTFASII